MVKTVTFGSAISLTVTNLEGSSKKIALIYLKTAGVKTAQNVSREPIENKNNGNKLWYPQTDFLLILQKSLHH